MDTVIAMKQQEKNIIKHIDDLIKKVEKLLHDNTVNQETLSHLKEEITLIRQKVHKHSTLIMGMEIKLSNLENKLKTAEK
jgi:hypothetical protein